MTKKIKEVYAWADEQEDYWDDITTKKIEQLDKITKSHLDWFSKNATISDILAWKRPVVETNDENALKQKSVIEVDFTRSVNDVSLNRQDSILKVNDLPDEDTLHEPSNKPHVSKEKKTFPETIEGDDDNSTDGAILQICLEDTSVKDNNSQHNVLPDISKDEEITDVHIAPEFKNQLDNISETPLLTHPSADSIITDVEYSEPSIQNTDQSGIVTENVEDTRMTPELDTDTNTQSQKIPTTPKTYNEDQIITPCIASPIRHIDSNDDDDDDEIKLVVAKRHLGGDTAFSPVRNASNQYTNGSPIRTASEHYINGNSNKNSIQRKSPTPVVSPARYQSPFMSRLFQLAQSSNSRDSKGSISSTHFITVRPKPSESTGSIISAKDNNISMNLLENHAQKRPIELVVEPRISTIEVSGIMPQPHFKKPKAMSLRKTNPVSNIPTPTADTVDKKEESKEAEVDRPIPSWARSPELYVHLKNQENVNPNTIFSVIPPLNLEDIFANPEIYLM